MNILLKNATVVATENSGFKVIRNGFIGIDGECIDYVGDTAPKKEYAAVKDMDGAIVIPGLVNCHGHSPMGLLRGIGSDLELMSWLGKIWPIEGRMTGEDFLVGTRLAVLEMLASGTTSFSDMYFLPWYSAKAVEESGMKANLCRMLLGGDKDSDYKSYVPAQESFRTFRELDGACGGRIKVDFGIHAEYTVPEHLIRAYVDEVKGYNGARMQMHMSETKSEHEQCIQRHGKTPAAYFDSLGVFDIPSYAAHCVWVDEADMDIMAAKGVAAVHNPESNMKLGSGFAPVPRMLEKGIRVTIGTDGAASNNNLNMLEEMHVASIIHKGFHNNPVLVNPTQLLRMATVEGARTQGRTDTGSIEVGKKADLCAISTKGAHMHPDSDTLALVAYSAQGSDVCMTMVDGRILYEDGEFLTMDKERIIRDADDFVKRMA